MNRIVDVHGHYVFGVDDGAETLPMSLEMIKMAYDKGVRDIFCTSHDSAHVWAYQRNLKLVRECIAAVGLDVRLHQGCEIYCDEMWLSEVIEKLERGDLLPLGNSKYVLLEFAPWVSGEEIISCARHIRSATEFEPVIAHIERYRFLYDDPEILPAIREMQLPIQINAYDLVEAHDEDTKAFARKLLTERLVTFLGSDTHGTGHRPVKLESGVEYIYENCDPEYADAVCFGNAEKLLLGGTVYYEEK